MANKKFEKIGIFVVVILIIVASVLTIFPTKKIEFVEKIPLDYDYIWNLTENISDVVYNAYNENDIPKGRAWGTKGEYFTADEILMPNMIEICNLDNVDKISIEYVEDLRYFWKQYSSKVETVGYELVINFASDDEPVPKPIFKFSSASQNIINISECFPVPTGLKHYKYNTMNCNYTLNNVKLSEMDILKKWPFGGTLTGGYYNISIQPIKTGPIIGLPIFISDVSEVPEDQEGKIFIIEDKYGFESIINKSTEVSGIIIINNDIKPEYTYFEKYNISILSVSSTQENLSIIVDLLKNDTLMIVDNMVNNETLTFTYNLENSIGVPNYNFVKIASIPKPEIMKVWGAWGKVKTRSMFWYAWNKLPLPLPKCEAVILCDYHNDTHFMGPTSRSWNWFSTAFINDPALPIFSINNSVGNWLKKNIDNVTVSGYLEQVFKKQTRDNPGVESYNVVGYKNIPNNRDGSTIVISNRYDGWWGQTPGDSGVGAAIVLGIGKYIADNDMPLKHNLLYLFTTGEEYGKRGACHYVDTHQSNKYNFILWIGLDQLAFNQKNTDLAPQFYNITLRNIVWEIANETGYSGYDFNPQMMDKKNRSGAEDDIWIDLCDTICFVKDSENNWTRYHRAGMNYEEGDSINYIDQNDVNATALLVLETVKRFAQGGKYEPDFIIISFIIVVIVILLALLIYQKVKTKS